jgi:hypothetical protein
MHDTRNPLPGHSPAGCLHRSQRQVERSGVVVQICRHCGRRVTLDATEAVSQMDKADAILAAES